MVSRHFPGRLRGRGQALFTITGYGLGGVLGVIAGGILVSRFGYPALFMAAAGQALLATVCAWRADQLERVCGRGVQAVR
jgi:PPP family 3-phenylpropionic acid transporter